MKSLLITLMFLLSSDQATVARVIDGDTFVTEKGVHVRLLGIDTPEKGECFYEEATYFLEGLILNKQVRLVYEGNKTDRYGRTLAWVYLGKMHVNASIVRNGYGISYRKYPTSKTQGFNSLEYLARYYSIGLWRECE